MSDQASHLRQLVREAVAQHGELAPGAPLIAVTGASAGVGATTVACGLARELARLGKHVVLVDSNLVHPSIAERFGVHADATLADVLGGRRRAVEALMHIDGLRLLAGVPPRRPVQLDQTSLSHLLSELAALSRLCDVVILDAGAGMSPWTDRLWNAACQSLVVATSDDAAMVNAYTTVKLSQHQSVDGKLRLIINRTLSEAAARHAGARFESTCRRFLGIAPNTSVILPAIAPRSTGDAVAAVDSPLARAVRALAAEIACGTRGIASVVCSPQSVAAERASQFSMPLATEYEQLTTDRRR